MGNKVWFIIYFCAPLFLSFFLSFQRMVWKGRSDFNREIWLWLGERCLTRSVGKKEQREEKNNIKGGNEISRLVQYDDIPSFPAFLQRPTDRFIISEPLSPSMGVSKLQKICQTTDLEASKLWNVSMKYIRAFESVDRRFSSTLDSPIYCIWGSLVVKC